jgi:hypothetical protein
LFIAYLVKHSYKMYSKSSSSSSARRVSGVQGQGYGIERL